MVANSKILNSDSFKCVELSGITGVLYLCKTGKYKHPKNQCDANLEKPS